MKIKDGMTRRFAQFAVLLMVGVSMDANAGLFGFGGMSWKEEVLLHDGKTLLVERWEIADPSGRRELGQMPPLAEVGTRFVIPGTDQAVIWKSDFGRDQQDNLDLLMLNFIGNTPYVVTKPARCHAYNKWGRPNPPYVFFKFDGKAWQQIPLEEFPAEFKEANLMVAGYNEHQMKEEERAAPFITAKTIKRLNGDLHPHLRLIARKPLEKQNGFWDCPEIWDCEELIYYKGSWIMPSDQLARDILDRKHK